jgi:uncharacterized protein YegJ (DUF2314 family)
MPSFVTCLAYLAVALFATAGFAGTHAQPADFPAGDPMSDRVAFEYAIYYLPAYHGDIEPLLAAQTRRLAPALKLEMQKPPPEPPPARMLWAHVENDVSHDYTPPDLHALKYFARGLSAEQAEQVQSSRQALVLDFTHAKADVWEALRVADEVVESVARKSGGLIWDDETRLLYTPDEWRAQRIATWTTPPDLWKHIAIHSYKNGQYVRSITLGMAKFGLPDIVVDEFSWANDRGIGNLINSFAQLMAEGARFEKAGHYDLDLRKLRNAAARARQLKDVDKGTTPVAHLHLLKARREDGDPRNRLIEAAFDLYPGTTARERQDAMLSSLFGAKDSIAHIKPNDELREASQKAVARLPALHNAFDAGLAPGEFIDVKVPFEVAGGGREYMWVEIDSWSRDGSIRGMLRNDPEKVAGLRAGSTVEVDEDDVFDYLLHHADGSLEGNETSKIVLKLQQESAHAQ